MSSDLYNRIANDRGSLPGILKHIPGFEGYMDLKARRTADRMVRDYLAAGLQQRINRLAQISRHLLDQNGMAGMSKLSAVTAHLQTYHDRIKAAAPGYSGFYESIKVDAAALDLIYSFDELQIGYVDKLDAALDTLDKAVTDKGDVAGAVQSLDSLIAEASESFSKRADVLTDIGKS